jgi:hypothetical protein
MADTPLRVSSAISRRVVRRDAGPLGGVTSSHGHPAGSPGWLAAVRRYLTAVALGDLVWEAAQMPLYTLWRTGTAREIALGILHCTAGDVLIASAALTAALVLFGSADWPRYGFARVAIAATIFGLGYTVHSERLNLAWGAWAYVGLMPTLPWLGTGLAPMAQWLLLPPLALAWACRRRPGHARSLAPRAQDSP